MSKSFLTEMEVKEFNDRLNAMRELARKYGMQITAGAGMGYNPLDVILTFYSERLETSSQRLNSLTWALIGLTIILAVLTGILVFKTFVP